MLLMIDLLAHPRPPRHRPRRLPGRQAPAPARGRPGRLHLFCRLDEDAGKYAEGDVRGGGQHVWVFDAESVEGDEA